MGPFEFTPPRAALRLALGQKVVQSVVDGRPLRARVATNTNRSLWVRDFYSGLIATLRNLITPAPCCSANGPSVNRPLCNSPSSGR